MTRQSIENNFRESLRLAGQLEEEAGKIRHVAEQRMQDAVSQLEGNWTGSAANNYMNKCTMFCEKLQKDAAAMENIAESLRNSALQLYGAQIEALKN